MTKRDYLDPIKSENFEIAVKAKIFVITLTSMKHHILGVLDRVGNRSESDS